MLWQLHENGLAHGDPRVPNVILNGEERLWIDLVEVLDASPTLKQVDAEILTRSILEVDLSFSLDVEVQQLIDDYGTSATQATLYRLAEESLVSVKGEPGVKCKSKNKRLDDKQQQKLKKHQINMVEFRHKKKERFGRSKNEHQRLSV
ncbi:hypothetical protein Pcac1_g28709 [Phytophthora cactorum]|nr:hypothetical protein Pcac1_g28709 [Phytophthora cactorum]